ncbi:MAG TPA: polysaccharide biosynthesis tyrosine autokinase [Thermomicrobiales bacterium]|nr:polysaccharide biosynthesis tyrosine autokinase [Thermomicrobiales bacterium]
MDLDLRQLMRIGRRWWWVLILLPVVAASSAYIASDRQTPLYSASAVLRINPPASSGLDQSAFNVSQNLGETYRSLITFTPVLDRVVKKLDLPYDSDELRSKTTASTVTNTQLVRVSVSDTDPDRAALIANTIASEFVAYNAEEVSNQIQTQLSDVNSQITDTEGKLATVDAEITQLNVPANSNDASTQARISDLRVQQAQLQARLDTLRQQSTSIASDAMSSQVQISIPEPAKPPTTPYAPQTKRSALLGAFVGLLLGAGVVALLEFLDNSVNGETDFAEMTGSTLLTAIPVLPRLRPGSAQVYTVAQPQSSAAEAVRLLRTNLEFAAAVRPVQKLAISSAGPGEGKSTVTANLGVVMAQAGFKTVIIDADLRRPTQHKLFGIPNERGLTRLLTHPNEDWQSEAMRVAVPGLMLIPSGPIPPNPADLLSLDTLSTLLDRISVDADVILLDTPPILAVSDALVVSLKADGMLLLARSGHTRNDSLRSAAASLHQGGIRLIGIILNQKSEKEPGGYYYYGYANDNPPQPITIENSTPDAAVSQRT